VLCYALVFAFLESLLIFGVFALAGFLISKHWNEEKRIILLGTFVWILAVWSIFFQYASLHEWTPSAAMATMIAGSGHPLRNLYLFALVAVVPTIVLPAALVLFSEKFFRFCVELMDRLSLLTTVYLFFDVLALCIVIFRNL
jgi:hypothetical protein